jgi:Ca-activated chloride channel family protein
LLWLFVFSFFIKPSFAFSWHDLWATKDQQAKVMMEKGDFKQAKETFLRDDWRAVSAYRAKEYEQAEKKFRILDGEEAYYNQGNALAHMKQYEKAVRAYDKTLRINPEHKDALHNRKIVEDLLKKEQEDQDKQDQNKQNQDKQNQDKQDQNKQDENKQNQDKQDQDKQDQDKKDQDKQDQKKQDQDKKNQSDSSAARADREAQQAKDQWLRLIPDDPGGLLREKFMRDHLRRQQGWGQ